VIPLIHILVLAVACVFVAALLVFVFQRNMHIWLPGYVAGAGARRHSRAARRGTVTHVLFAVVDHFEPALKPGRDPAQIKDAMLDWMTRYPQLAARHRDSDGRPPRHTWAYPVESYQAEHVDQLVQLCRQGLGEVEVQIHHDGDTADTFRAKMLEGLSNFARHGVSVVPGADGYRFGFVHGNWSLDNSRPDGRWCGVNNELIVLRELGCFADATLPSAPSATQTRRVNSIYYAADDPERPKSHNTGISVRVGGQPSGDLLLIQGPLLLDWHMRKFGVIPRTDNAALTGRYPGYPHRVDAWVRLGIAVTSRPEWVFVKTHCHGALAADRDALLGDAADRMLSHLETSYGSGAYRLHYVTLREMYNIVKATEAGKIGNPYDFRDFLIPPYKCVE